MKIQKIPIVFFSVCLGIVSMSLKSSGDEAGQPEERSVLRGKKIVMSYCALCHGGEDGTLSGKGMEDIPKIFGTIHAPNITKDEKYGIGSYSRDQLKTLLRTRIKKDGKKVLAMMPAFPLMADSDIEAIIDFLKSDDPAVAASSQSFPPQKVKALFRMFDKKVVPLPLPSSPIPLPDSTDRLALGKYYVTAVFRCYECHNGEMIPDDTKPDASSEYLSGGHTMYDLQKKKLKVPNITPDKTTGIGDWTSDDFYTLLQTGLRKNGRQVRFPMAPIQSLTRAESDAIYAYIMSVKPIRNKVK